DGIAINLIAAGRDGRDRAPAEYGRAVRIGGQAAERTGAADSTAETRRAAAARVDGERARRAVRVHRAAERYVVAAEHGVRRQDGSVGIGLIAAARESGDRAASQDRRAVGVRGEGR